MWSISIYRGDSPFSLEPADPVLTKDSVTDVPAAFVADPFMLRHDDAWHMFFEVMNAERNRGEIGLATSDDALSWTYQQIVLKESFHLSYPHVFEFRNEYFMVPETLAAGAVCLYKADDFPSRWSCVAKLVEGQFADPTIFHFNDRWWMFACSTPYQHDTLRLFNASALTGPWMEHPQSPIINGDKRRARPAGRVLELDNKLFRFAQDCVPQYGSGVSTFEITRLTPTTYTEVEIGHGPLLKASGNGWNASGMHHIDARQYNGQWLACVDGTP
ncbi:MAG TPA: hypothetical protein VGP59_06725 [Pyrinomonadaceae bacterium]|nr:hypothetical protein [Pyrinomonadaceae bacterium]